MIAVAKKEKDVSLIIVLDVVAVVSAIVEGFILLPRVVSTSFVYVYTSILC